MHPSCLSLTPLVFQKLGKPSGAVTHSLIHSRPIANQSVSSKSVLVCIFFSSSVVLVCLVYALYSWRRQDEQFYIMHTICCLPGQRSRANLYIDR